MSTYVLMRLFEASPRRYDIGLRVLTLGRIDGVRLRVASLAAAPGVRLLDLGCGTGELSLACAARGAEVIAVDHDPLLLAVARNKLQDRARGGRVRFVEAGAGELAQRFSPASFDAAVSCLCLSEMEPPERGYVLGVVHGLLRPGGRLVVADEVLPRPGPRRVLYRLARAPLAAATRLACAAASRPIADLEAELGAAGFAIERRERRGGLAILAARREER
ncbi:MAG: class I SAM-dependent methyltransferase [Acidobacteria bacterium]|nr:MAG: class I SAM-dependent methyltransferase [Acidobacteriota bacterium]